MNKSAIISLFLLVPSLFFLTLTEGVAEENYSVDFKSARSRQVLITVPRGKTVTADDDFAVIEEGGAVIASVYPFEIQTGRFWSQPLSPAIFERITIGASVLASPLSGEKHRAVRDAGSAQWSMVEEERRSERLFRLKDTVRKRRETADLYMNRLDSLREALLAAERDLLRIEEMNERRILSLEEDIDDLFREILDLEDEREELFQVRERLSKVKPRPDEEIRNVSDKIAKISRSVRRKRRDVVHHRERRRHLWDEIRSAERRLREISVDLAEAEHDLRDVEVEVESLLTELEEEESKWERDKQ